LLDEARQRVFAQLKPFSDTAVLGGGTGLSMQLGHRKSYDFDLLVKNPIEKTLLRRVSKVFGDELQVLVDSGDEMSFLTSHRVKVSFIYFPFPHLHPPIETESLPLLHWKDIASDKAYAIGRRGEYRDYVDVFFVLRKGLELGRIIEDATRKFKGAFSAKLFLGQLVYLTDLKDFALDFAMEEYSPEEIRRFLEDAVVRYSRQLLRK
jgi:predicted nucleotidyltransferase component of viral defense system